MPSKIKSIKKYNQQYKNLSFSNPGKGADDEFLEFEIALDENGHITEESRYSPDGELEEKNSFVFNPQGKLLEHTLHYVFDDATEKRVLTRNEKGNLISEVKYYGSETGEKTDYEYNDKDNVIAIIHYDEDGVFTSREDIKYDEKGNPTERAIIDADKKFVARTTFSGPENNQVEEVEYNDKNEMVSKTVIKFTDDGKELSSVQTTPQGKLISSIINKYDEKGNIIEKVNKDFYSKTIRYEYDEHDRLITQEMIDDSGTLLRKNMYEYDEEGNTVAEQNYEMDTSRGGRDKHFGTRYEYAFY